MIIRNAKLEDANAIVSIANVVKIKEGSPKTKLFKQYKP